MTSIFRLIYLSKYLKYTISGSVRNSDIDRVVCWKGWNGRFRVEVGRGMEGCVANPCATDFSYSYPITRKSLQMLSKFFELIIAVDCELSVVLSKT